MKFAIIVCIIACVVIAIYATNNCGSDALNALSTVKATALQSDSCGDSRGCTSDGTITQTLDCTYSTPLTDSQKNAKCNAVKSAVNTATADIAHCSVSCDSYNNMQEIKFSVTCTCKSSGSGGSGVSSGSGGSGDSGGSAGPSHTHSVSLLKGLLDSILDGL